MIQTTQKICKGKKCVIIKKMKTTIQFLITACLVLPTVVFSVTDDVVVEQVVDNSCNENGVCEADLGETVATCPTDCQEESTVVDESVSGGGIHPDTLQSVAQLPPIEIFNIDIFIDNGTVGILWETNKPTATTLILSDSQGKIQDEFAGELYLKKHNIKIDNLDLTDERYYFKIFAKGAFGDDNYDYAELFALIPIGVSDAGEIIDLFDPEKIDDAIMEKTPLEKPRYKIIKADDLELSDQVIAPQITDADISQKSIFDSILNFGERAIKLLHKTHIIGENSWSSFVNEYKFLIAIFSGILFFLVI